MGKRIILASIGALGLVLTLMQAHSIGFYLDRLYSLAGLQTEAEELVPLAELALATSASDSAGEQVVIYRKKQFASATEQAAKEIRVWATAYTSHPMETDDTPLVTASGSIVRDGIVASNFLPMGSKLKIPALYGDKVFVVEDRMNTRYNNTNTIDIWFESRADALQFGRRSLVMELL